MNLLKRRCF